MTQKHHIMHGRDHAPGGSDPIPGLGAGGGGTAQEIITYSLSGPVAVGNGKLRYYPNAASGTIPIIFASVNTPPSPSGLTVRVKKTSYLGPVTVLATITIGNGQNYNYAQPPAVATFASGDYFTVDVTAVGSTQPGADLVVQIQIVRDP